MERRGDGPQAELLESRALVPSLRREVARCKGTEATSIAEAACVGGACCVREKTVECEHLLVLCRVRHRDTYSRAMDRRLGCSSGADVLGACGAVACDARLVHRSVDVALVRSGLARPDPEVVAIWVLCAERAPELVIFHGAMMIMIALMPGVWPGALSSIRFTVIVLRTTDEWRFEIPHREAT